MTPRARLVAIFHFTLAAALPAAALAAPPVAVSPGSPDAVGRVETACPTFSWTYDPEATAVEVAVYRLERSETGASAEEAPPALAARLPAGAVSWTPDAGDCLDPEVRYAWFVRAEADEVPGAWSEGNLFEVRPEPRSPATAAGAAAPRERGEAADVERTPSDVAIAVRLASPVPGGTPDVRPAVDPVPKPEEPVSFRADGGVVIGGNYRFSSPRQIRYRVAPGAFQVQRSDEDEGWRLQDSYGFVPTMSGAVADVHLVAPLLDLPAGATITAFHCDGYDGVEIDEAPGELDVDDLAMTMSLVRRRERSLVREVIASTSLLTEGSIFSIQSSVSGSANHRVSSLADYTVEVAYRPESQGSSLRFYGCSVQLEVDALDPR